MKQIHVIFEISGDYDTFSCSPTVAYEDPVAAEAEVQRLKSEHAEAGLELKEWDKRLDQHIKEAIESFDRSRLIGHPEKDHGRIIQHEEWKARLDFFHKHGDSRPTYDETMDWYVGEIDLHEK